MKKENVELLLNAYAEVIDLMGYSEICSPSAKEKLDFLRDALRQVLLEETCHGR